MDEGGAMNMELEQFGAKQGGLYRHYKGGLYLVLGLCRHSETQETLIIYCKVPDNLESFRAWESCWARPAAMWAESVEWKGRMLPRFSYIAQDVRAPRIPMNPA